MTFAPTSFRIYSTGLLSDEEAVTGIPYGQSNALATKTVTPSQRLRSEAIVVHPAPPVPDERAPLIRGSSTLSESSYANSEATSSTVNEYGQSTFGQTLFNCVAMLVGIGLLSVPLAFAYSGWLMGTVLILSYGFISCYTAKILGRIILTDTSLRCYSDIARKAFGPWSTPFISLMFCLELFAVSVLLVTLYADSLHSLLPRFSADTYKLSSLILILPTVFLPLSFLSYSSILGILSTIVIIFVILVDGLSKQTAPGSLWSPAETSLGVSSWANIGIAFGLFIAGFGCHPLIPSLAQDMVEPHKFERMINLAFAIATFIYALMAVTGYLMFGDSVSGEISMDLLKMDGYNKPLNHFALWMLALSPLSKFALTTQPLTATLEILLRIEVPRGPSNDEMAKMSGKQVARENVNRALRIVQRICVTLLSVVMSVLVPGFSEILAFLGCSSAFMLCVIGPLAANASISGRCGITDGVIMVLALTMAVWGTIALFL
ncbi:transmembrane amino acid transporter protein-domain-containing protein [Mycena albidolilacea]|uniref:Transmembrane amino acid transporter protein-domain-containing protein n=1 Tax=Mycena albidolilacea TaxID=1033008 RepID=A0AAD7EZ97_9AGAR|nr:transmembrane amino acid transporter protein-domain-containing protein [Mycena albidolilacea]